MVKMLLLIASIAALVIGGVVEFKVHPDRIGQLPATLMGYVQEPSNLAGWGMTFTNLKRQGEQLFVRDEEKRFELSLGYVKTDAEALQEHIKDTGEHGEQALARAQLLAKSMSRVEEQLNDVPVDVLTKFKDTTRESFTLAESSLKSLKEKREAYAALEQRFGTVTEALEEQLAKLFTVAGGGSKEEGEVAGAKDEPKSTPTSTQSEIKAVPLNF